VPSIVLRRRVESIRCQQTRSGRAEKAFGKLTCSLQPTPGSHACQGRDDAVSTDEGIWDLTLDINAKACSSAASEASGAAPRGRRRNTGFVRGAAPARDAPQIAYTASKGAVLRD